MDINNVLVRKIKCTSNTDGNFWGCDGNHHLLEVGKEYTLLNMDTRSWHTVVYLAEFPGIPFNSCAFVDMYEDDDEDYNFEGEVVAEFTINQRTDVLINVDLEKFRWSLVGDGYLREEAAEMAQEELINVFKERINAHINAEYDKSVRLGLLDDDNEDDDDER